MKMKKCQSAEGFIRRLAFFFSRKILDRAQLGPLQFNPLAKKALLKVG